MNFRGFQIKKAIIIFFLIIVLGMAAQYYLYHSRVIGPLTRQLEKLPGVLEAKVVRQGLSNRSTAVVHLALAEDVPLSLCFQSIWQTLEEVGGEFIIKLEDSADLELWDLFQKIQLVVEEAVMTGEFTLLEERVHQLAHARGVRGDVALDRNYVYLRLRNDQGMLQRVISRGVDEGKIIIGTERMVSGAEMG